MKVLLIKVSSLGDIIHTFPALTEASEQIPDIEFDWVVEESYAEIPAWHPCVGRVIPVALRRWRKRPVTELFGREWRRFRKRLREQQYDLIIDAQGLLKSAILTKLARGDVAGYDRQSAREAVATIFYNKRITVERHKHAIARVRELFSQVLGYEVAATPPEFGLTIQRHDSTHPYLLFFHGTTWQSKHATEKLWCELILRATESGYRVYLPWGSDAERHMAESLAGISDGAEVLGRTTLQELVRLIQYSAGAIAVDTGLAHLATAIGVPVVALFGPTDPELTGVDGELQVNVASDMNCSPCFKKSCNHQLSPDGSPVCFNELNGEEIYDKLQKLIRAGSVK